MKRPGILTNGHVIAGPTAEWTDGLILGNGGLGAVMWGNAERVCFGLSKHDVWNRECAWPHGVRSEYTVLEMRDRFLREGRACLGDDPPLPGKACERHPTDRQTPVSVGTLELEVLTGVNVLSFTQALFPAEGRVTADIVPVDRRKSYGQRYPGVHIEAFVDADSDVLHICVSSGEGDPVRVAWRFYWPQHIGTYPDAVFAAEGKCAGTLNAVIDALDRFESRIVQSGTDCMLDAGRFSLSGTVTAFSDSPAYFSVSVRSGRDEQAPGLLPYSIAKERTLRFWSDFWDRSMLYYSEPRLNDLWAIGLYAMGASTRPDKNPPSLQGIWNLSPRAIWHSDFHFNTNIQESHWLCGQNNHPELAAALFRMLLHDWRGELRLLADEAFGIKDAVALGVGMDADGRALGGYGSLESLSNTAWTAMTLWDLYTFSPDPALLPGLFSFLRECCNLYDALMLRDENGIYHTVLSSSPERTMWDGEGNRYTLRGLDCTINVSTIRALYEAAAEAARLLGEDGSHYADTASHMPPLPVKDGVLIEMATGYFHDGDRPGVTKECHRHPSRLMPVFPAGQIGLFSNAETLALGRRSFADFLSDGEEKITGWSFAYLANIASRLGLADEAERLLGIVRDRFTLKGLLSAHNPLQEGAYPDALFQIEALLAVPAAMAEMALQSAGGEIRVFPAVPAGRDCAFEDLRARGGVLVSAELTGGSVSFVALTPEREGPVCLVSPWDGETVSVNGKAVRTASGRVILQGHAGETLRVTKA